MRKKSNNKIYTKTAGNCQDKKQSQMEHVKLENIEILGKPDAIEIIGDDIFIRVGETSQVWDKNTGKYMGALHSADSVGNWPE